MGRVRCTLGRSCRRSLPLHHRMWCTEGSAFGSPSDREDSEPEQHGDHDAHGDLDHVAPRCEGRISLSSPTVVLPLLRGPVAVAAAVCLHEVRREPPGRRPICFKCGISTASAIVGRDLQDAECRRRVVAASTWGRPTISPAISEVDVGGRLSHARRRGGRPPRARAGRSVPATGPRRAGRSPGASGCWCRSRPRG